MKEKHLFTTGLANWHNFTIPLEQVLAVAKTWSSEIKGIERPWLCWNVDPEWCLVQQRLVSIAGWTPVVGGDPRAPKVKLTSNAVFIDFNKEFNLPNMHFLFPLEFCWLFADKLAFWHSDLLIRKEKIKQIAMDFERLKDGDIAVTVPKRSIKNRLLGEYDRYWELVGCTTKSASKSQFESGSGWFSNIRYHPNCKVSDYENREKIYWDHGAGIKYWHKKYADKNVSVVKIPESFVEEGHCTRIRNKKYIPQSPNNERRNLTKDLSYNFSLKDECERLSLSEFC